MPPSAETLIAETEILNYGPIASSKRRSADKIKDVLIDLSELADGSGSLVRAIIFTVLYVRIWDFYGEDRPASTSILYNPISEYSCSNMAPAT